MTNSTVFSPLPPGSAMSDQGGGPARKRATCSAKDRPVRARSSRRCDQAASAGSPTVSKP